MLSLINPWIAIVAHWCEQQQLVKLEATPLLLTWDQLRRMRAREDISYSPEHLHAHPAPREMAAADPGRRWYELFMGAWGWQQAWEAESWCSASACLALSGALPVRSTTGPCAKS